MTIEELKQVEFTIDALYPADSWMCIRSSLKRTLADCDYPELPPSRMKDCKPWVGRNVLVQHVIVRVGYEKEPLDMPNMLIAEEIAKITKAELGIEDLFETIRVNSNSSISSKYYTTSGYNPAREYIAETIVDMFQPLVFRVRGKWREHGKVERKVFGVVLDRPYLVTLNGTTRKITGTRWPGSSGGYWDPDGYEGPTFAAKNTYELLTCNQSVIWSPTNRQTAVMVHPVDILQEVPEADQIHQPRMDQIW